MVVAMQMAALAACIVGLGLVVRWGQMRAGASYLAGRLAASLAGIIMFPPIMAMLGAKSGNEVRTYAAGGAFGFAGYWLATKLWRPSSQSRRRRR